MITFNRIFDSAPINLLEKALAGSSLRHKVITNNIANINTPGYKKMEVSFEEELAAAADASEGRQTMVHTHPNHLLPGSANSQPNRIRTIDITSLRTDGNNVDIDAEMAAMTKNNIFYNTVAQRIGGYYNNIKLAIKGG